MIVIALTGSRTWTDRKTIEAIMAGVELLLVGDCPDQRTEAERRCFMPRRSADAIALEVALANDVHPVVYCASPARAKELQTKHAHRCSVVVASDWANGNNAGPLRNKALADRALLERQNGMDVRCHALLTPGCKGTLDCKARLTAAGFVVTAHGTL